MCTEIKEGFLVKLIYYFTTLILATICYRWYRTKSDIECTELRKSVLYCLWMQLFIRKRRNVLMPKIRTVCAVFWSFSLFFKLSGFLDKNNDLLYRNGKEVISFNFYSMKPVTLVLGWFVIPWKWTQMYLIHYIAQIQYLFWIYCMTSNILHGYQKTPKLLHYIII